MAKWLNVVVLVALLAFIWAAIHGFRGHYCLHSYAQDGCGSNASLSGEQILIGAPITIAAAAAVSVLLSRRN